MTKFKGVFGAHCIGSGIFHAGFDPDIIILNLILLVKEIDFESNGH